MCGIAGIIKLDGQNLPETARAGVKLMTDAMRKRGPDGEGQWLLGPICLGHRRLSIIDLAGGDQPMLDASGRYAIVFNGEIYNFLDLRQLFQTKGYKFKTNSDTEVILAAYAFYGKDCVQYLEGMFAFALWDKKNKLLFCARDHFGKKPFYYSLQKGYFIFASELTALASINCPFVRFDFSLKPLSICQYLAYEYVPAPNSIYREVHVLEPAHYLPVKVGIDKGNLEPVRYWSLPYPENNDTSEEEICAHLRELMTRSVKMRMISDVPLGVFLSGGIDSTIVTGLMAQISGEPVQSFSIGFKEASYDESRYAKIAANAYNTKHFERILSAEDCALELPKVVSQMDTPMADASCAPTWLLSALAREHVTVCLGGDGADEFWAGYEHYIGYYIAQIYNRLPVWLRKNVIEKIVALLPESAGYINLRLAVNTFLKGAASPDWLRVQTMLTSFTPGMQKEVLNAEWLNENGLNMLQPENLFASTNEQYSFWQNDAKPIERAFHVYIRQFMLDDILVKVDRISMLHSLEVRAPFLDKKVAEFTAKLPVALKLHGFRRKYLLKKSFQKLLPPEILHRNKRGFQIPVAAWLRGRLKPLLQEMLGYNRLKAQGIFNPQVVEKLMQEHFSEKRDLRKQLWTLLVFQLWLEANKKFL